MALPQPTPLAGGHWASLGAQLRLGGEAWAYLFIYLFGRAVVRHLQDQGCFCYDKMPPSHIYLFWRVDLHGGFHTKLTLANAGL